MRIGFSTTVTQQQLAGRKRLIFTPFHLKSSREFPICISVLFDIFCLELNILKKIALISELLNIQNHVVLSIDLKRFDNIKALDLDRTLTHESVVDCRAHRVRDAKRIVPESGARALLLDLVEHVIVKPCALSNEIESLIVAICRKRQTQDCVVCDLCPHDLARGQHVLASESGVIYTNDICGPSGRQRKARRQTDVNRSLIAEVIRQKYL